MNRQTPMQNKVCGHRDLQRNYDKHIERLSSLRKTINTDLPDTLNINFQATRVLKRLQTQTVQTNEREIENKILLNKIFNIIQKPCNYASQKFQSKDSMTKKSLNKEMRKRQLDSINNENQRIFENLQGNKSHYDVKQWNQERQRTITYLNNIKEFKAPLINPSLKQSQQQQRMAENIEKIQVCSKQIEYNNQLYQVDIFLYNKKFIIIMKNFEHQLQYVLTIDEFIGLQILKNEFGNNVDQLILKIEFQKNNFIFYTKNEDYNFSIHDIEMEQDTYKDNNKFGQSDSQQFQKSTINQKKNKNAKKAYKNEQQDYNTCFDLDKNQVIYQQPLTKPEKSMNEVEKTNDEPHNNPDIEIINND